MSCKTKHGRDITRLIIADRFTVSKVVRLSPANNNYYHICVITQKVVCHGSRRLDAFICHIDVWHILMGMKLMIHGVNMIIQDVRSHRVNIWWKFAGAPSTRTVRVRLIVKQENYPRTRPVNTWQYNTLVSYGRFTSDFWFSRYLKLQHVLRLISGAIQRLTTAANLRLNKPTRAK